jgi:C_GCAxxG_C_C family probable redox protein
MNKTEEALATFSNGFNCAQAVLSVFAEDLGMPRDTALKIASGLGAGLGRQGKICGVVLGAYMVLSLKAGSPEPNAVLCKELTYRLTRAFDNDFMIIHHSLICRDLLHTDISTPEGYRYANENGLFSNTCPVLVSDAIMILEHLLSVDTP